MKCPEFSQILDKIEGRLEPLESARVESHLSDCGACADKKTWAERSMQAMKSKVPIFDAPEYALRKAIALMPEKKAGFAEWILAKLDFDSWAQPAIAGVRAEDRGIRQFVYVTDAYRIHLMLEPQGKTAKVTGQVIPKTPEHAEYLVELADSKKLLNQTKTSDHGEFLLEGPRNKELQLKIHGEAESVLISCRL